MTGKILEGMIILTTVVILSAETPPANWEKAQGSVINTQQFTIEFPDIPMKKKDDDVFMLQRKNDVFSYSVYHNVAFIQNDLTQVKSLLNKLPYSGTINTDTIIFNSEKNMYSRVVYGTFKNYNNVMLVFADQDNRKIYIINVYDKSTNVTLEHPFFKAFKKRVKTD